MKWHKLKYKNDPNYRIYCIQKAREYYEKCKKDPLRKRRRFLSHKVSALRIKIDNRLNRIRLLERQLLDASKQLEEIKEKIKNDTQRV